MYFDFEWMRLWRSGAQNQYTYSGPARAYEEDDPRGSGRHIQDRVEQLDPDFDARLIGEDDLRNTRLTPSEQTGNKKRRTLVAAQCKHTGGRCTFACGEQ